jgi:hypothetical protein
LLLTASTLNGVQGARAGLQQLLAWTPTLLTAYCKLLIMTVKT